MQGILTPDPGCKVGLEQALQGKVRKQNLHKNVGRRQLEGGLPGGGEKKGRRRQRRDNESNIEGKVSGIENSTFLFRIKIGIQQQRVQE